MGSRFDHNITGAKQPHTRMLRYPLRFEDTTRSPMGILGGIKTEYLKCIQLFGLQERRI
jgi:hypothetical protein